MVLSTTFDYDVLLFLVRQRGFRVANKIQHKRERFRLSLGFVILFDPVWSQKHACQQSRLPLDSNTFPFARVWGRRQRYLLRRMTVQRAIMLKELDLLIGGEVLVAEKHDSSLCDQQSQFVQLGLAQL